MVGVSAAALAGCASSERLADAFGNPFQSTASATDPAPASTTALATAPVKAVQSRPLPPPVAQSAVPVLPSAKPMAAAAPASATAFGGWTAQGGTPITVAQGDSAETLARRYGIPLEALVRTNGFVAASEVRPGTRLVVPVYSTALAAANAAKPTPPRSAEQPRGVAVAAKPVPPTKTAAPARAALKAAPPARSLASRAVPAASTAEGPIVIKPQGGSAAGARKPELVKKLAAAPRPEPIQARAEKLAAAAKPEAANVAKAEPSVAEPRMPAQVPAPVAPREATKANVVSEMANPEFRWPARGRIIQGFKLGGNDGINIAVPEGTSVKAAENGVVAYAGELKGYGNLVMIRHSNGFVSAYANNGGIDVKRGDTVKRGQTIAKSGQSGDVSSPQLHFELRKGATPVDPTQYLAGL
jgi:murein DD-endopeptidase MepM/ murein hydrolase activator NlpD